jgi:5'-3' exonuclease
MDEIFASIFNYVNTLVNLMQPRKRIFIAIDGVAPRAKMNNQRQRRYFSARTSRSMNEFLLHDLQTNPGLVSFKNNSISPGTDFMFQLIDKIKYMILRKLHEDEKWRKLEIIFTGGDCPGEGEHKILDWIRGWKQSSDFDINESHCIYSNDADLIFLGLSLHIPKVVILREENPSGNQNTMNSATNREPKEVQYELLFINLIREYMSLEFRRDMSKYNHNFDIERIIDDFILIAFFIGNDFLHQLYCMSAKKGNFDEIITIFKNLLPRLGGYLSEKGEINWPRFLEFVKAIESSGLEEKMICSTLDEMKGALRWTKRNQTSLFHKDEIQVDEMEDEGLQEKGEQKEKGKGKRAENDDDDGEMMDDEKEQYYNKTLFEPKGKIDGEVQNGTKEKDENRGLKKLSRKYEIDLQDNYKKLRNEIDFIHELLIEFRSRIPEKIKDAKLKFYSRFFGITSMDQIEPIVKDYIKGIQFVLNYYMHKCPSWNWYYPYFLSPFLSDFVEILEKSHASMNITFDLSTPYAPYTQLACILPRESLGLLPKAYEQALVSDPSTSKYFQEGFDDFEPFDGVWDYQWIARLQNIDEKSVVEVLSKVDQSKLSDLEIGRNKPGTAVYYKYDPSAPEITVPSLIKGLEDFSDTIRVIHQAIEDVYVFDPKKISLDIQGYEADNEFPSLHLVPGIEAQLFSKNLKNERLILTMYASAVPRPAQPFKEFVYYDYPFRKIAYVNSMVEISRHTSIGHLPPEVINSIYSPGKKEESDKLYEAVSKDCLGDLYHQKGINYDAKGFPEKFYSLETRKHGIKSAKHMEGHIEFLYDHIPDVLPEGLLFPVPIEGAKADEFRRRVPRNESHLFQASSKAVNLCTGDLVRLKDAGPIQDVHEVEGVVVHPHLYSLESVASPKELIEDTWFKVDASLLKSMDLYPEESWMLFTILDSMVIDTDLSKTSSIVLGNHFDIGLRFFHVKKECDRYSKIVIDLIK